MSTLAAASIANDSLFCDSRRLMGDLEDDLTNDEAMEATHDEVERLLQTKGRELLRQMMQAHYDARAARERRVVVEGADGVERGQVRTATRQLETVFGTVEVERRLYQAPGVEGLAPLDAAMGLPAEKYSMEVRRVVAEEIARASFDEVAELIEKRTGAHVPKRQVEELAVRSAQDFDAFYDRRLREAEATTDLMVLSFDGKGIATRHEDLRDATRRAAERTPRRLETRLTSGEKRNRKRMAQVATVHPLVRRPTSCTRCGPTTSTPSVLGRRTSGCGRASSTPPSGSSTTPSPRPSGGTRSGGVAGSSWSMASGINSSECNAPRARSASRSRSSST
jgi:hypothetical protein